MLARRFLPIVLILLWIAGVHHCAFECFGESNLPVQSECPSHASDDASSHEEGEPCGISMVEVQSPSIAVPVIVPVRLFSSAVVFLRAGVESKPCAVLPREDRNPPNDPLGSLSIASNAPPVRA